MSTILFTRLIIFLGQIFGQCAKTSISNQQSKFYKQLRYLAAQDLVGLFILSKLYPAPFKGVTSGLPFILTKNALIPKQDLARRLACNLKLQNKLALL